MRIMVPLFVIAIAYQTGVACHPRVVTLANAIPADVQLKLARVTRVWIAGFHAVPNRDIDLDGETVRLIRQELRRATSLEVIEAEPLVVPTEDVFSDRAYWRRLASEHGSPLIVTGTVNFLVAPATTVQRGRHTFVSAAGRVLDPEVVIIDGRNGDVILKERIPPRMRYGIGRFAFTVPLYFDLMERAMPDWIRVIAAGADLTGAHEHVDTNTFDRAADTCPRCQ
jgi:hypothetical protein